MIKEYALKERQICLFFIAFLPVTKVFMLPSVIAQIAGEDLWLATLLSIFIDFITAIIILYACKKNDCDYFELLKRNFGDVFAKIIFWAYAVYFTLKAVMPVCEQKDYIDLTLYSSTPAMIYFLPFFIFAFYFATKKMRVIGRTSDIMWLFTALGATLLTALSLSSVDFGSILPIGAAGIKPVFKAFYTSSNWYGDAAFLLIFMGNFKTDKKGGRKIIYSYALAGFLTVVFMFLFYGVFTSIAFRQRFALTEISKYSTVINNLGRFDYIGILSVLSSAIVAVSMQIYAACYFIKRIFNIKYSYVIPAIITVIVAVVPSFFYGYYYSIHNFFMQYFNPAFFLFSNVIPILTVLIKFRKNDKSKNTMKERGKKIEGETV